MNAASAKPAVAAPASASRAPAIKGRLEWPLLLGWLREDGWITTDDADRVTARFRAGSSSLHALGEAFNGVCLLTRTNKIALTSSHKLALN